MSDPINMLDGFSGIGGFALAMKRAGFKIKKHYYSEVDKYAQWIYRKQFPGAIRLGDITKIGNEHGKIDLFTGGFPCQSFSIAGNRGGFSDTRGTLFFEIERLAQIYRPSYMVLENVKGLFSHDGGNTIRIILDELRGLDYSVQLLLLNTLDFGIPQNRERCFFICTFRGKRQPEISHIREAKAADTQSANCIDANYWKGIDNHAQRSFVKVGTLRTFKDGNGFREVESGNCPTIQARAREDGSGQPVILLSDSGKSRKRELRNIAPPLRAHDGCGHDNYTFDSSIIRRLTPIECERLQDYPDGWTESGVNENGEQIEISDTQRYKTLGNSITVKPAELIMKAIKEVINV